MTTVETPRLLLRPFRPEDFATLHRILSDPVTMRFWPSPFSRSETERWMNCHGQRWQEHGFGRWAVTLKDTQELIGDCGIVASEIDGEPENDLGYIIHHPFCGHGYATEAAEACKAYGFDTLRLSRLCANMPANHWASRRIAEKIGMRLEKEFLNARNRNLPTCLYALQTSDLNRRQKSTIV